MLTLGDSEGAPQDRLHQGRIHKWQALLDSGCEQGHGFWK